MGDGDITKIKLRPRWDLVLCALGDFSAKMNSHARWWVCQSLYCLSVWVSSQNQSHFLRRIWQEREEQGGFPLFAEGQVTSSQFRSQAQISTNPDSLGQNVLLESEVKKY